MLAALALLTALAATDVPAVAVARRSGKSSDVILYCPEFSRYRERQVLVLLPASSESASDWDATARELAGRDRPVVVVDSRGAHGQAWTEALKDALTTLRRLGHVPSRRGEIEGDVGEPLGPPHDDCIQPREPRAPYLLFAHGDAAGQAIDLVTWATQSPDWPKWPFELRLLDPIRETGPGAAPRRPSPDVRNIDVGVVVTSPSVCNGQAAGAEMYHDDYASYSATLWRLDATWCDALGPTPSCPSHCGPATSSGTRRVRDALSNTAANGSTGAVETRYRTSSSPWATHRPGLQLGLGARFVGGFLPLGSVGLQDDWIPGGEFSVPRTGLGFHGDLSVAWSLRGFDDLRASFGPNYWPVADKSSSLAVSLEATAWLRAGAISPGATLGLTLRSNPYGSLRIDGSVSWEGGKMQPSVRLVAVPDVELFGLCCLACALGKI